ncbi:acetylglucosaminyltransferase [Bacteroidia bacterium]|nr:acetylglucosaminyltransferase [Bacteroidia bacterium]
MKYVAVLMTVHNRREKTLCSLRALYGCALPDNCVVNVYLTDDGSTDGTAEAVAKAFPMVRILHGDGNLYWNRGMINSWREASSARDYDFYLWLNDDTYLRSTSLEVMLGASALLDDRAIVVGTTLSSDRHRVTYGGWVDRKLIVPDGTLQRCTSFNGNIVLVPGAVFDVVGMLDGRFHHNLGDIDYGLRAGDRGIASYVAPVICGYCDRGPQRPPRKTLRARLADLYSPLASAHPRHFFLFELRHHGLLPALAHWIKLHLRALMPHLEGTIRRMAGKPRDKKTQHI